AETLQPRATLPEEDHFESFVARETIRFMQTYRDEPLFMVASFLKPHNPFAPPAEHAAMYRPEEMTLPTWDPAHLQHIPAQARRRTGPNPGTPEGDAWARRLQAAYYGNVTHLDACVGRIVDALDETGLAENTLVLYTTDHGEMLYEHGLRGKFNFFEPSARIPLIARLPGRIAAGTATHALVDQADFVPTLLDVAKIGAASGSKPADGTSFAPVLSQPDAAGKAFAFGEFGLPDRPFYMRRDDHWKYIYYTAKNGGGPTEELYDPAADPGELTNLAVQLEYRKVVAEQRGKLLGYLQEQGVKVS
ncbi:MAG TPA: sulfatase-like hydrolase/transferase, partial [Chloroflexota bacterium]|nr:sulfatase-like hydrolase/transferase [Chloroflexota bacterium]